MGMADSEERQTLGNVRQLEMMGNDVVKDGR